MSSKIAISSAQETSQSKLSDMTALRELTAEVVKHELRSLNLHSSGHICFCLDIN